MTPDTSADVSRSDDVHPAPDRDGTPWYLIYTRPRQENRALNSLQQQAFEVYLPLHQSERLQRGKLRIVEEPLFKRYLFVHFAGHQNPWHAIRNTLGVSQLVHSGGQPAKVPAALVDALRQLQTAPLVLFQQGDSLRITDGPFRDLQVVFEMADGDSRAIVLIQMLNRLQKISVSLDALRSAD